MLYALHSAAQASAERQRVAFERLSPAEKTDQLMKLAGGRAVVIDPIPVKEELDRIQREQRELVRRGNGALALGWFSTHALSKSGGSPRIVVTGGVLPDQLRPIASATTDAEKVFPYLDRAFREHHRKIIERAIELADLDFKGEDPR